MGYALRSDEVYQQSADFGDVSELASDTKYVMSGRERHRVSMPFAADFGIYSSVPALPENLRYALLELKRLAARKANWNSYGALPLSTKALRPAVDLLIDAWRVCKLPSDITGNPMGGVDLSWEIADREMEIGIYPDGRIEIFRDAFDDKAEIDDTAPLSQVRTLMQEFLTQQ